jgi:hypothetical protein
LGARRAFISGRTGERRMKASDIDKEDMHPIASSSREWLRVVGAVIAILLVCFVWTF